MNMKDFHNFDFSKNQIINMKYKKGFSLKKKELCFSRPRWEIFRKYTRVYYIYETAEKTNLFLYELVERGKNSPLRVNIFADELQLIDSKKFTVSEKTIGEHIVTVGRGYNLFLYYGIRTMQEIRNRTIGKNTDCKTFFFMSEMDIKDLKRDGFSLSEEEKEHVRKIQYDDGEIIREYNYIILLPGLKLKFDKNNELITSE